MTEPFLQVVSEDLFTSGGLVEGHMADLIRGHIVANDCVASSLPNLPGLAVTALTAKLTTWQEATVSFSERLSSHALAFTTSGADYLETDAAAAQHLQQPVADLPDFTTLI